MPEPKDLESGIFYCSLIICGNELSHLMSVNNTIYSKKVKMGTIYVPPLC